MFYYIRIILNFVILFPAITAIVRFKIIDPVYRPFIYCIWLGLINEVMCLILIHNGYYTIINFNVFQLLETFLFIWQFKKWGLFENGSYLPAIVLALLSCLWIYENLIFSKLDRFCSYYLIIYSIVMSLFTINMFNRLMIYERGTLLKNPVFLICIAFIIYYTINILSEIFFLYASSFSEVFQLYVNRLTTFSNLIGNLLFGFAVLWMPTKQKFSLPSY